MNKKLLILLPITVLFLSPWLHSALYHNLLTAVPDMESSLAHGFAIFGALIAGIASVMIATL